MKYLFALGATLIAVACVPSPLVELHVDMAPTPIMSDGLARLGYELLVSAIPGQPGPIWVERLEVFADDSPASLVTLDADELRRLMVHPVRQANGSDPTALAPGQTGMVHLWITIPKGANSPRSLRHVVALRRGPDGQRTSLTSTAVTLESGLLALGAPLQTGMWLVHEGPGNPRAHHWAPLETSGRITIPQRFALDLIGLDAGGRAVRDGGLPSRNEDWVGYGAEVLAVADGTVGALQEGRPNNPALVALPSLATPTMGAVAGNFVILDLGEGRQVLYAHLQPGSVAVQIGQRVSRGDILGRVGSSGNSNAPHLHFQVLNAIDLAVAQGLPYVFESFNHFGENSAERAILGPPAPLPPSGSKRLKELPLDGAVVGFLRSSKPF